MKSEARTTQEGAPEEAEYQQLMEEFGLELPGKDDRLTLEAAKRFLQMLRDFGFKNANIKRAHRKKNRRFLRDGTGEVRARLENYLHYGFLRAEVVGMVDRVPAIIDLLPENVNSTLRTLEHLGFSKFEVINIIYWCPGALNYSDEGIQKLFCDIADRMGSWVDAIELIHGCPSLLTYSFARTNAQLDLLEKHGINPLSCPEMMVLSKAVMRGRLIIRAKEGEVVQIRHLVNSHSRWQARFGDTKEEVIAIGMAA